LGLVAIDKRLRRHEAAGEGDIELAWKSLAPKRDRRLLKIAVAQLVGVVHEDRSDAIHELAGEIGVAREMHPAEFLYRREPCR
jgi:hypothetical protein